MVVEGCGLRYLLFRAGATSSFGNETRRVMEHTNQLGYVGKSLLCKAKTGFEYVAWFIVGYLSALPKTTV
jgi:hypothetical protein